MKTSANAAVSSTSSPNSCQGNMLNEEDKQALQYIENVTSNADEIQRRVLTEILSTNAHVEYLQQHGFNESTDHDHVSTFKKLIPVVSYEQLSPYIDRIANGDASPILCAQPITKFFMSSATSGGEPKLIPMFEQEFTRRLPFLNYLIPRMKQLFPNFVKGKGMYFHFTWVELRTKAGIIAHAISTSTCKSSHFNKIPSGNCITSPLDIIFCTNGYQSLYCQLLCGLYQNDSVLRVGALLANTLIHAFKFLECHWLHLANDIRTGTIDPKITDPSLRNAVMNNILIKPNPELADLIEAECSKGTWEGIITRLWPNTEYINTIVTGSMSHYIPLLNYYTNDLPLISDIYASSECFFGLNLDPLCKPDDISYTLIPTMAYFEFLPINRTKDDEEVSQELLVDLVDVKLGQEYELIITTYAGLYRYCMGDILRVTGFKNKAPKFSFVCRRNVVLSIGFEKTDEAELHNAVQKASRCVLRPFGAIVVDYTSYADSSTIPGHYVLYWEIRHKKEQISIPASIYEDCCLVIEESLNVVYHEERNVNHLNPLEIKIVEVGTFEKLMEGAMNQGTSISQYKTPRCVKSTQIIQLLNSRVLSNYFSQKCPKWDPTRQHHLLST